MVEEVRAYKCGVSGALFTEENRAVRSEFRAKMKQIGGNLPAMGSVSSTSIMEWLASTIECEIYPTVSNKLIETLTYWRDNGATR